MDWHAIRGMGGRADAGTQSVRGGHWFGFGTAGALQRRGGGSARAGKSKESNGG